MADNKTQLEAMGWALLARGPKYELWRDYQGGRPDIIRDAETDDIHEAGLTPTREELWMCSLGVTRAVGPRLLALPEGGTP